MKYYHNNRCRKSREGLEFLKERNINPEIIEYMKSTINKTDIEYLLKSLDLSANELMRKNERVYKENIKGKKLSENELIKWMIEEPILIERPIFVKNGKAEIGRPAENFLKII